MPTERRQVIRSYYVRYFFHNIPFYPEKLNNDKNDSRFLYTLMLEKCKHEKSNCLIRSYSIVLQCFSAVIFLFISTFLSTRVGLMKCSNKLNWNEKQLCAKMIHLVNKLFRASLIIYLKSTINNIKTQFIIPVQVQIFRK